MKNAIRKIGFIFLLLVVTGPLFYALFLQIDQYNIRCRMKEKLEDHILQTIIVAENNVHWIKAGEEISVNGKMFDIKSYKNENGYYTFTGLYDDSETALVKQLKNTQEGNNTSDKKLLVQLFEVLQDIYNNQKNESLSAILNESRLQSADAPSPCSQFITIITPPPQV